jgi:hypothetical protein
VIENASFYVKIHALFTEVSNVASKYNGVTCRAITFRIESGSNFDSAITSGCDNSSNEL